MGSGVIEIPVTRLLMAFLPVLATLGLLLRWSLDVRDAGVAVARMVLQLIAIGFVLTHIFASDDPRVVLAILVVMLVSAGAIALRPLSRKSFASFTLALGAIAAGGVTTLIVVSAGVLRLDPWYMPRYLIPLAGMIFANAMNSVSLAAERFDSEIAAAGVSVDAKRVALRAALIPITNSLVAVGLVSLPGMMTGQILSGVSPLIAVRYQIMVMCMVYGSAGLSAGIYLHRASNRLVSTSTLEAGR